MEAITFAGAASADKLDNEFLASRGIRPTSAKLTKSAFSRGILNNPICFSFVETNHSFTLTIEEKEGPFAIWHISEKGEIENGLNAYIESFPNEIENQESVEKKSISKQNLLNPSFTHHLIKEAFKDQYFNEQLANFLIYSPEISSLRKFDEESQIKPLGIKGEGIFNVLQIFNESYPKETLEELKHYLHIIEWFKDFEAVGDSITGRKSLVVKDRYMPDVNLNQYNVN